MILGVPQDICEKLPVEIWCKIQDYVLYDYTSSLGNIHLFSKLSLKNFLELHLKDEENCIYLCYLDVKIDGIYKLKFEEWKK